MLDFYKKKAKKTEAKPRMANLAVQTSQKQLQASIGLHGTLSVQMQGCDIFSFVDDTLHSRKWLVFHPKCM